ncbi:uncharacterized protein PAC_07449 [Phialocephala subalpina]|uniref:Uncharacterized protein n=1 Tax=Phialocephala subalpina TaxID=576137 RepID=A0A1L7WXR9_9HELO|nr:uncharacterized protein PAC_07449 [Phialocephala subalpina]
MASSDDLPPLSSTIVSPHGGVVTCMKATPRNIFLGLDTGIVSILDADGTNERKLKASKMGVWCLDVWEDGGDEYMVVGGVDSVLGTWSVGTFEKKAEMVGHTSTVRCVKVLSATTLISSSRDSTLRIWDIETAECRAVLEGHSLCVRSFAVNGDIVVSVSYDHDARVWSLDSNKFYQCQRVLRGHEAQVYAVDFDGSRIVTGALDHSARVWDPDSGSCLAVFKVEAGLIGQLKLISSMLIGADNGGKIHMWSLDGYNKLQTIEAHVHSITSMQCIGSTLVSGAADGKVKVWNMSSGELLHELASSAAVWKVAISNQKIVAVFSRNSEVVLEPSTASSLGKRSLAHGFERFDKFVT